MATRRLEHEIDELVTGARGHAARLLRGLADLLAPERPDPVAALLDEARADDEALTPEETKVIGAAWAEYERAEGHPLDEIKPELA